MSGSGYINGRCECDLQDMLQAPFGKMVRKGFARLLIQDCLRQRQKSHEAASTSQPAAASVQSGRAAEATIPNSKENLRDRPQNMSKADDVQAGSISKGRGQHGSISQQREGDAVSRLRQMLEDRGTSSSGDVLDKELEQAAIAASVEQFDQKAAPGTRLGRECGNMYAASVHASLASLVYEKGSALEGKRILASSFGSGLAASIFCIRARHVNGIHSLESIAEKVGSH